MKIDIKKMLKVNEGVRLHAYKDSLGIFTIACGENVERPGEKEHLKALGINADLIFAAIEEARKAGKSKTPDLITMAEVDILLDHEIASVQKDLRANFFKDFDTLPDAAQAVITDMRFQLGSRGLSNFKNTLKAMREGKWKEAAKGLRSSLAYKQTPKRWEANAKLLESI